MWPPWSCAFFLLLSLAPFLVVSSDYGNATLPNSDATTAAKNTSTAVVPHGLNETNDWEPNQTGCFGRPWVCRDRPFFPRPILCCRDRCVDVTSDIDNCGFCGIRCPPLWGCCHGLCFNINFNPFHCGRCFNRCMAGQPCIFGVCTQLTTAVTAAEAGGT